MDDTKTQLEQAKSLYAQGKLAESEEAFLQLIDSGNDIAEVFYYIGLIRGSFGDWRGAANNLKDALERDPRHANALYQLGFIAEHRGNLQEAISYYRKAQSARPEHAGAQQRLEQLLNSAAGAVTSNTGNLSGRQERNRGAINLESATPPELVVETSRAFTPGTRYPLVKETTTIGRTSPSDIVLEADDSVSRAHAEITRDGGSLWIEDLNSRNGTLVNGQRLSGGVLLRPGDDVAVGSTRFRYVSNDTPAETPPDSPIAGAREQDYTREAPRQAAVDAHGRTGRDLRAQPPDGGAESQPMLSQLLSRLSGPATSTNSPVVGVVRGLQSRSEPTPWIQFLYVTVWTFSVERTDEAGNPLPPITVQMKGHQFDGVIHDGDEVEVVTGRGHTGELVNAKEVYNRTKNATVRVRELPGVRVARIGAVFVALFILGVFFWIISSAFASGIY
jgi:hypothetical protein